MNIDRTARLAALIANLGLIAATLWLLSLDTEAQANWKYAGVATVLFTGLMVVGYGVRRYRRLDELERVHLIALAVAFIGTLVIVVGSTVFLFAAPGEPELAGLAGPSDLWSVGLYLMGAMVGLYAIGWTWGRSLYR